MAAVGSGQFEQGTVDDITSFRSVRAFAGSLLAGLFFWAGALAIVLR